MAVQKFALEAIQKVRNAIQADLAVNETQAESLVRSGQNTAMPEPRSLDALSDVFTFGGRTDAEQIDLTLQPGWFVSTVNPASVLLKLPGLRLKPGYRLVGYLYRSTSARTGLIFALPEALSTTAYLETALANSTIDQPPQPEGAMPHFMAAIDGDRSAASFMLASMLRRELQEFGLQTSSLSGSSKQSWSHHRLIQALPDKLSWQWQTETPRDWFPKASVLPDGQAAVEFFSCQISPSKIVLYRHLDRYAPGGYESVSLDRALAVAGRS